MVSQDNWAACEALKTPYNQIATHLWLPLPLPIGIPESMFCFCFQSPSLKLHALEADLGPSPAQGDPQGLDSLPAQQEPLFSHEQSQCFTQKLPPSSSAQRQHTVDSSQHGKNHFFHLNVCPYRAKKLCKRCNCPGFHCIFFFASGCLLIFN